MLLNEEITKSLKVSYLAKVMTSRRAYSTVASFQTGEVWESLKVPF